MLVVKRKDRAERMVETKAKSNVTRKDRAKRMVETKAKASLQEKA